MVGTVQDITERKRGEAALHQSEEHLRFVIDASTDGIWEWEIASGKVFWSERIYTILGLSPESFEPGYETQRELIHPDDLASFEQATQAHLETGQPYHLRVRYRHSDGTYIHVLVQGRLQRDAQGQPLSHGRFVFRPHQPDADRSRAGSQKPRNRHHAGKA